MRPRPSSAVRGLWGAVGCISLSLAGGYDLLCRTAGAAEMQILEGCDGRTWRLVGVIRKYAPVDGRQSWARYESRARRAARAARGGDAVSRECDPRPRSSAHRGRRLHPGEARGVHRRVLLARLHNALPAACEEPGVLGRQGRGQPSTRSGDRCASPCAWVDRTADLGTRCACLPRRSRHAHSVGL